MLAVRFRQLLPAPGEVAVEELLAGLQLSRRAGSDRPYTVVNFVASADGRASFHGRSGALGDEGDRAMFHGLRENVDAVLAGTNTLRVEGYGRILGREERRHRRLERGEPAEPLACVISRSGDVPLGIPLFAAEEARIALFAPREPPGLSACAARVDLHVLAPEELELPNILAILRRQHGIRSLLCEGGPALFGALLAERLVDELFVTLAPQLAGGGEGPPMITGPEPVSLTPVEITWLLEREGSLYLRYRIHQPEPVEPV